MGIPENKIKKKVLKKRRKKKQAGTMKLFGIFAGYLAGINASGLGHLENHLKREFTSYQSIQSKTTIDGDFMTELNGYVALDTKAHGTARGVRGLTLMPEGGQCGLHWSLCPNMCNLEETLQNKFAEIVGNKMEKYQQWKTEVETKKRKITEDLVGKLHQVEGLEEDLRRNGQDREKQQDLFLSLLEGHLERANNIHENLLELKTDFVEIGEDLTSLTTKVETAHTDCYDQAPCMAVPKCKLGVASGKSCADIAQNAIDLDDQNDPTLTMESAVHIIQPDGLEPKAAICEFDYTGTGFTVVQNRHNNTGAFTGDFENGFGTTVGYDDAECEVANYYLGNKYIRAITEDDSSLKVIHHGNSIEQWNKDTIGRNSNLNLKQGGHVCGDDTIQPRDVKLGNGGINGQWEGKTQISIGKDKSPDMEPFCVLDYPDSGYNSSDIDYDKY